MLRFIALRGVRAHKNVAHLQHRKNVIYKDLSRVVELFLQLKTNNKSNIFEPQHKHMYYVFVIF